jgi:hypothetical protein
MKKILFILFSLASFDLYAQTGIGTLTPDASAKLEVASTKQGFLPPRLTLTGTNDVTTIKNAAGTSIIPATGLLIYNTASVGTAPNNVVPGYYYWNGTVWIQIASGIILDNTKTTSFTLTPADNNKLFIISSALTVTVSNVSPNTLPVGFSCQIIQAGSGIITMAGSGATLNSSNGLKTRTVNSAIGLVMLSATTGYIFGDTIY